MQMHARAPLRLPSTHPPIAALTCKCLPSTEVYVVTNRCHRMARSGTRQRARDVQCRPLHRDGRESEQLSRIACILTRTPRQRASSTVWPAPLLRNSLPEHPMPIRPTRDACPTWFPSSLAPARLARPRSTQSPPSTLMHFLPACTHPSVCPIHQSQPSPESVYPPKRYMSVPPTTAMA